MDLPVGVLIHNEMLGLKGTHGVLMQIAEQGYFVAIVTFGDKLHRVLLPISDTVLILEDPEEETPSNEQIEVER